MTLRRKVAAALVAAAALTPVAAVYAAPACPEEDSASFCRWDAASRGNGTGESFLSLPGGGIIRLP